MMIEIIRVTVDIESLISHGLVKWQAMKPMASLSILLQSVFIDCMLII